MTINKLLIACYVLYKKRKHITLNCIFTIVGVMLPCRVTLFSMSNREGRVY